jgi:hypothetical protein
VLHHIREGIAALRDHDVRGNARWQVHAIRAA